MFPFLDLLEKTLKYNILDQPFSRVPLLQAKLPDIVQDACVKWIPSVCTATDASEAKARAERFSFNHMLHWLEAMSIMGDTKSVLPALNILSDWLTNSPGDNIRIQTLIADTMRFVQAFHGFFEVHPLSIYTIALPFTPTETVLYQTFHDVDRHPSLSIGCAKYWSSLLSVLPGRASRMRHLALSPNGHVATGSIDDTLFVYDLLSGKELLGPLPFGGIQWDTAALGFSADGELLAAMQPIPNSNANRLITVFDQAGTVVIGPLDAGAGPCSAILFSPDQRILACVVDSALVAWSVETGAIVCPLHQQGLASLAFLSNTKLACGSASEGTINIIDVNSGSRLLGPLEGHQARIVAMHASPDGTQLSTLGEDWSLLIWNGMSGTLKSTASLQAEPDVRPSDALVKGGSFSHDGSRVLARSISGFSVWDALSGANIYTNTLGAGWLTSAATWDGSFVVTASKDRMACLWTAAQADDPGTAAPAMLWDGRIQDMLFSPSGAQIALVLRKKSGGVESHVHIINTQTGSHDYILEGHQAAVRCIAFSADGSRLVSGSEDRSIRLWTLPGGAKLVVSGPLAADSLVTKLVIHDTHEDPVATVSFSSDSKTIMSTSCADLVHIWDASTGIQLATISIPSTNTLARHFPRRAAFSQDGQRVVSCNGYGDDMRIWDALTGAQILGPLDKLGFNWRKSPSVGFSTDGSKVYMKAYQLPRYEWDVASGKLLDGSRPDSFSGDALDPLVTDMAGRWIVDAETEQPLSGLPLDVPAVLTTASCRSSIAIVTEDQKLFVLHFPTRTRE